MLRDRNFLWLTPLYGPRGGEICIPLPSVVNIYPIDIDGDIRGSHIVYADGTTADVREFDIRLIWQEWKQRNPL